MTMARHSILGSHLTDITELQQIQPHTLLRFAKPQRDLYNLLVISRLRIGPKLITASALDSMLASPKVKVKGKVSPKVECQYVNVNMRFIVAPLLKEHGCIK